VGVSGVDSRILGRICDGVVDGRRGRGAADRILARIRERM